LVPASQDISQNGNNMTYKSPIDLKVPTVQTPSQDDLTDYAPDPYNDEPVIAIPEHLFVPPNTQ
jgi:hypothetical protein